MAEPNADEARRRFGMAPAWAVRRERIRNNPDQIAPFLAETI